MSEITRALARAGGALFHPKMFLLMVWPLGVSLALWTVLALVFGSQVFVAVEAWLAQSSVYQSVTSTWPVSALATGLLWILMFVMAIPLVLITATIIIGVLAMPIVVKHVAEQDFPTLERRQGGSIAGSVWNAMAALAWFIVLTLVTLPLWFIPLLWPVIPVVLLGYFNQRMFRYDSLAEHADAKEMQSVIAGNRGRLWLIGIALGFIGYIPLVGFFSPVFSALAFTYFALERLAATRTAPVVS